MTARLPMTDVVIVLPGIGGSTLSDRDGAVFAASAGSIWRAVRHRQDLLEKLAGDDSLDDPDAPQPITPAGLIGLPVAVPGFGGVTAYRRLRRRLMETFALTMGDPDGGGPPANYFEFAYDWRRDNRVNAARLRRLVDRELPRWSAAAGEGEPKVILVAHSMGGLVAKYYLDALDGWRHARALITFGTPFRGSVKALEVLANGVRKAGVELGALSALARRFTSVYQLLPRYPVLIDEQAGPGAAPLRVAELATAPGGLDLHRAKAAREDFHRMMDPDRSTHAGAPLHHLVDVVPVIGYGHPTLQSAVLDRAGRVRCAVAPARAGETNPWYLSGDRTVPALSALPVELSETAGGNLENQTHGILPGHDTPVTRIVLGLARYGAELADQQYPVLTGGPQWEPALGLEVDEVFESGEPVVVRCAIPPQLRDRPVTVTVDGGTPLAGTADRGDDGVVWTGEGLPDGTYTVTVTAGERSVSDVFEIG